MAKYSISPTLIDGGFRFDLIRSGILGRTQKRVSYSEWAHDMHPAVGFLKLLADNGTAVERDGGAYIEHSKIADMPGGETRLLDLPVHCSYSLHLNADGAVSDTRFNVRVSWLDKSGANVVGLKRYGCLLRSPVGQFLIGEPFYSLLEEVERFNDLASVPVTDGSLDARMVQFGRVKEALARVTAEAHADDYLKQLTIHHATGPSVEAHASDRDRFVPVLFGDAPNPMTSPENEEIAIERCLLLGAEQADKFRNVLFPRQGARRHYRLGDGVYAVVDAPVEAALRIVEKVNASDQETKAAFRANPRSFLIEAIERAGGSGDIICDSAIIREPMEYGERVLGITQWDGSKVSFTIPVYRNWFARDCGDAEIYTLEVPGLAGPLAVDLAEIRILRDAIENARAAGRDEVTFNGKRLPLTPEFEQTIAALAVHGGRKESQQPAETAQKKSSGTLLVLRAAANEEDLVFNAGLREPRPVVSSPQAEFSLNTQPKPHQVDGIAWLQHAFLSGMPGVLLADDMGLGKTLQALAFLHWLRGREQGEKRPILIVAPKKLLDVWRDEIRQHIGPEGLGRPVLAYDEHLRRLKIGRSKDGQIGQQTLDIHELRNADWVLTTYETLRDYHFSFAKVRFRVAVYDEAQKMKGMSSLINNAAKCQQPDFTILMTGTPVENSALDLWTLLDIAWPGFLGMSGKEFATTYGFDASADQLAGLKTRLTEPVRIGRRQCPQVMLRRFKSEILTGLPNKTERKWPEVMTQEQASVYDAVLADQRTRRMEPFEALHALRMAAFHPDLRMPSSPVDHERLIAASARFRVLFRILDQIARVGERALVFVDLHRGQQLLAELIRARYRLSRHPQIINGDTPTNALGKIKDEFQQGSGFDVLLLGPRSAGFGLTLTAANHVVHMNRWWNPAVEDQCSDRVYRLGQDKDVTIHIPIAIHPRLGDASFDVVLDTMLTDKRSLSREIVVPTNMTKEDLQRMLAIVTGGGPARFMGNAA